MPWCRQAEVFIFTFGGRRSPVDGQSWTGAVYARVFHSSANVFRDDRERSLRVSVDRLDIGRVMDSGNMCNRLSGLVVLFVLAVVGGARADISCNRTTLSQCLATIEPLLDNPALARGIPSTEEAVQARCKMFKTGMACVDEYKNKCLPIRQRQAIERGVAGAKYTFAFLCDDPVFQSEFLKHHSCFRAASTDWEHCANHFQNMVAEEINAVNVSRADRNLGLCCAKHGFLRCVYYSAQFKCRKDAALFLMKVAQTLTDTQVHEDACRRIKFDEVCTQSASGFVRPNACWLIGVIFIVGQLVVVIGR